MSLTLRPMEPRDVPYVAAIDRLSFPTPWPAAAFRSELKRECATYLVLVRRGKGTSPASAQEKGCWFRRLLAATQALCVIGYVGFRLESGQGHITTIALRPHERGKGLGEYLLLVALEKMAKSCVDVVTLEMRPSNEVAYRLYRKYGFQVTRFRPGYYRDGEDAWVMEVTISDQQYQRRLRLLRKAASKRLSFEENDVGQITGDPL